MGTEAVLGDTVDVVVLGATIAGLTAAIEAAHAGLSVAVLDPLPATRFGFGLATLAQGPVLREIELHRGVPAVREYVEQTRQATAWLNLTLPMYSSQLESRTGFSLAVDGHLAFHLHHEARLLRQAGVTVATTDLMPLPVITRPALVLADQHQLDPREHQRALHEAAVAAGVTIRTEVRLRRFAHDKGWRVGLVTEQGPDQIVAHDVIDTVGVAPWGHTGLHGLLRVAPIAIADATGIDDNLCVFTDTPASLVFVLRDELIVVGKPVPIDREQAAAGELVGWVSSALNRQVRHVRTRHLEQTADRVPIVGQVPMLPGAWLARGFGEYETTSGTAGGLQLAAALLGHSELPWAPLRLPTGAVAMARRFIGRDPDPMMGVPGVLRRRGLSEAASA